MSWFLLICVGEALQCILCKVIALATQTGLEDVCMWCGSLYSGLLASMERVIHAVCELFDLYSDDSWGLSVDA